MIGAVRPSVAAGNLPVTVIAVETLTPLRKSGPFPVSSGTGLPVAHEETR